MIIKISKDFKKAVIPFDETGTVGLFIEITNFHKYMKDSTGHTYEPKNDEEVYNGVEIERICQCRLYKNNELFSFPKLSPLSDTIGEFYVKSSFLKTDIKDFFYNFMIKNCVYILNFIFKGSVN